MFLRFVFKYKNNYLCKRIINLGTMDIQYILTHTDTKIKEWYKLAKKDYGVVGQAKTSYNGHDGISINFTENGIDKVWLMPFYPEYVSNGIDWVYACWQELK